MVTGSSVLVFLTTKVKVTSPPVSGTAVGLAVLVTSIVGQHVGEVDGGVVVVGGLGVVVVDGLGGEDVDVVGAAVVALDPLGEGELAGGAGRQDGADLAVGIAGQRAVDACRSRLVMVTGSSVLVFLTTKVKVTSPPVSGTAVGLAVLVTSIVGSHVGEVDRGVVGVGGLGVVIVDGLGGEHVDVVGAAVVALDPLGEGELAGGAGRQDGADLAVVVAGQGAVHAVAQAGDGHRLFGARCS